jgi:gliding motility-associated lipoprotein GldD
VEADGVSLGVKFLQILCVASLLLASCEDEEFYSPKPRGYPRVNFPEKTYRAYDSLCPYSFEIPTYARMAPDRHKGAEPCWQNLEFPQFRATLHLSYKPVQNNLATYLDDSHDFANRHQVKATGLDEIPVMRDSARVYGLVFDISGNTASSVQFYLTDSTRHFLRGALYFNAAPNSDSLKIVVDFIKKDILHLINTTAWKPAGKQG